MYEEARVIEVRRRQREVYERIKALLLLALEALRLRGLGILKCQGAARKQLSRWI